jgi:CheY-like chemotaxis protein
VVNPAIAVAYYESESELGWQQDQPYGSGMRRDLASGQRVILIAEDDQINRLVASRLIARALPQARIELAEDGDQAVDAFFSASPSLVFMDVQMPGRDGLEATQEIRAREVGGPVPIIALTAGTSEKERDRCLEFGMSDLLPKPITAESVRSILDRWLPSDDSPRDAS